MVNNFFFQLISFAGKLSQPICFFHISCCVFTVAPKFALLLETLNNFWFCAVRLVLSPSFHLVGEKSCFCSFSDSPMYCMSSSHFTGGTKYDGTQPFWVNYSWRWSGSFVSTCSVCRNRIHNPIKSASNQFNISDDTTKHLSDSIQTGQVLNICLHEASIHNALTTKEKKYWERMGTRHIRFF